MTIDTAWMHYPDPTFYIKFTGGKQYQTPPGSPAQWSMMITLKIEMGGDERNKMHASVEGANGEPDQLLAGLKEVTAYLERLEGMNDLERIAEMGAIVREVEIQTKDCHVCGESIVNPNCWNCAGDDYEPPPCVDGPLGIDDAGCPHCPHPDHSTPHAHQCDDEECGCEGVR